MPFADRAGDGLGQLQVKRLPSTPIDDVQCDFHAHA